MRFQFGKNFNLFAKGWSLQIALSFEVGYLSIHHYYLIFGHTKRKKKKQCFGFEAIQSIKQILMHSLEKKESKKSFFWIKTTS